MSGADEPPVVVYVEPKLRRFRVTLRFDIEAKDYQEADDFVQNDPYSSTYDALDGISVEIKERKNDRLEGLFRAWHQALGDDESEASIELWKEAVRLASPPDSKENP